MPSRHILLILGAGIAAGLVFSLSATGAIFIYLAIFPLLLLGLAFSARTALPACVIACITGALLTDASDGVFFAFFTALPALYFVRAALRFREGPEGHMWYPVLSILTEMIGCACLVFIAAGLLAGHHDPAGLAGIIKQAFVMDMHGIDPEMAAMMHHLINDWSFLLFAITGWSWVLAFYILAIAANSLLASRHYALRPSLSLTRTHLPAWLLWGFMASFVFCLWGQPNDRFIAKVVLLLFLLPYFLSGLTVLHHMSLNWRGRGFWLLLFYFTLLTSLFPALLAVFTGLGVQVAEILDKPRKMG